MSTLDLILLAILLLYCGTAVWFILLAAFATEGWEDEEGFHEGKEEDKKDK
jgi:hypothetical protein